MRPRPLLLLVLLLLVPTAARAAEQTLVVKWNDVLLECVRRSKLGPPMVARAIGEVHTCGYDAWAMYDDVAVGTRTSSDLRRPAAERTDENRKKAFSYAEYRALLDLFPGQADFIRTQMTDLGYDPADVAGCRRGRGRRQRVRAGRHRLPPRRRLEPARRPPRRRLLRLHRLRAGQHGGVDRRPEPLAAAAVLRRRGRDRRARVRRTAMGPRRAVRAALRRRAASGPPARWPHGSYVAQANEILRHQRAPRRPREDDRRVLGRRPAFRAAARPLVALRRVRLGPRRATPSTRTS